MRRVFVALLSAALLALGIGASSASAAAPNPSESPGCGGLIVAQTNHNSGPFGASGNPNASAGPGFFIKGQGAVPDAIAERRGAHCSGDGV
jgi:hypothetical protein